MKTTTIILAVALIALMTVAALLIIRYMRKLTELESRANDITAQEKDLQKRHNRLDRWETELKDQCRRQSEWDDRRKHVYANVAVQNSDPKKPDMKAVEKSLSMKIGYAVRREFPDIQTSERDGRTIYSADFYVTPFTQDEH